MEILGLCHSLKMRALLFLTEEFVLDDEFPKARSECGKAGATLPIIKNDKDNAAFNTIADTLGSSSDNIYIVLDMVCNKNKRLEWIDGSAITYSRHNSLNFNFDCQNAPKTAVSRPYHDDWYFIEDDRSRRSTIMCVASATEKTTVKPQTTTRPTTTATTTTSKATSPTPTTTTTTLKTTENPAETHCRDYLLIEDPTDASKPCYKAFTSVMTWERAQEKCASEFGSLITINSAEENKYFWRAAVSYNMLDGMHIGGLCQRESTPIDECVEQMTWVDGEIPLDGNIYQNFMSAFPIPGAGECSSMVTETTAAQWINENCDLNEQPFFCRRTDFTTIPSTCPSDAPKAGEDIFPPGFPNADTPCEYMLFVDPIKLVELHILTLITDENKDFLEILEGTSGPHLIANLTGTILTTTNFKTAESNVLRVNWKPSGTGNGRGFRIRYNQVDA